MKTQNPPMTLSYKLILTLFSAAFAAAIRILTLFSLLIPAFSLQYSPQLLSVLLLPLPGYGRRH